MTESTERERRLRKVNQFANEPYKSLMRDSRLRRKAHVREAVAEANRHLADNPKLLIEVWLYRIVERFHETECSVCYAFLSQDEEDSCELSVPVMVGSVATSALFCTECGFVLLSTPDTLALSHSTTWDGVKQFYQERVNGKPLQGWNLKGAWKDRV